MEELPLLAKLHKKLAKQGGTVLGINVDPQQAEMRAEANRLGLPFPIVHDPEGKFGLTATILPTTVVFDRSGKQLLRLQRPIKVDDPELKAALQKAGLDL
jgi:peroxiredoxin